VISDSQFTRNKENTPIAQEITGASKTSGCYNNKDLAQRTVQTMKLKFCTEVFTFANKSKYFPRARAKLEL